MDAILKHNKRKYQYWCIGIAMTVILFLLIFITVGLGAMEVNPQDVIKIIVAKITGRTMPSGIKANEAAVVWNIRLPRILSGALVGMGLSIAGTVFQSLLVNPLADPYTLGVSTGAAFGAALAILLNVTLGLMISTVAMAFLFAFLTLITVIFIAQSSGGMLSSNLVIAGIIVSAILSSGISFIKMLAGENVSVIVFWLMGSLSSQQWTDVKLLVPAVFCAGLVCFAFANDLNVMTMGEESAVSLGIDTKKVRLIYLVAGSCITAVCVAVSGVIGFIGLVVPHILRFWLTPDNRVLIPLSGLLGAILLCVADNVTRLFFISEVPVGVITTLVGGPFFIFVFMRRRHGWQ